MPSSEKLKYALLLSAATATACSGSESDMVEQELDGGGQTGMDAATEPDRDAGADGSTDPGMDASEPQDDAAGPRSGSITVTTYVRAYSDAAPGTAPGTRQPDIDVLVVNPDGTLGPVGKTGPDGVLVLEGVYEGSIVTALYEVEANEHFYVSYAGVKPGDSLQFGEKYFDPILAGANGTHTLTFEPFEGADSYAVQTNCDPNQFGVPASTTLNLYPSCQSATTPVLLRAYDSDGELIATKFVASIDGTPGSSSQISGWNAMPAANNFTFTMGELDPLAERVSFNVRVPYAGYLEQTTGSYPTFYSAQEYAARLPTDGPRQLQEINIWPENDRYGRQAWYLAGPASTSEGGLNGPTTLPWLTGSAISPLGVTWQQTAGSYDGVLAMMQWRREVDDSSTGYDYYTWVVALPPGQTSFAWDKLPAQLQDRLPTLSDTLRSDSRVMLLDLSSVDSYDQFRATPEWMLTCPLCAVREGDVSSVLVTGISVDGAEGGLP